MLCASASLVRLVHITECLHGRHAHRNHSFREYGVSDRLYREAFEPMLLVGLFAPGEQCSAAGALGMLYFFILAVSRKGACVRCCCCGWEIDDNMDMCWYVCAEGGGKEAASFVC